MFTLTDSMNSEARHLDSNLALPFASGGRERLCLRQITCPWFSHLYNGAIHDLFLIGLIGGKDELTKEKQLELWLHLVS